MDKVFLLSDVDEFYDQLEKIFKGNQTDVQGRTARALKFDRLASVSLF